MQYLPLTIFIMLLATAACTPSTPTKLTEKEFIRLAATVAEGWNTGNARLAADCFDANAVYEEPPRKQFYKGYDSIFAFFGGEKGFDRPMKMKWHHLAFNESEQTGFGEYTFSMNNQYHGIVIMQLKQGKIIKWREYQYKSSLDWKQFTGESNL